jgi:titin
VALSGTGTNGNIVSANYIGTKAGGTEALANDDDGVCISDGAQSNFVGGDAKGEGKPISGNASWGVSIRDSGSVDNVVLGNHIGTDAKGGSPLPNSGGVSLSSEAQSNSIGGDAEGERNVISGNTHTGIAITTGRGNVVSGNYIGTDVTGALSLGNGTCGVIMQSASRDNRVGEDMPGERNVISANGLAGIEIRGVDTMGNMVKGNYIGTDVAGRGDLGNAGPGCMFQLDAQYNTVGPGNVIAYNSDGVLVSGSDTYGNIITRNSIFANDIDPIALSLGGNLSMPWPVIDSVFSGPVEIGGTSCPLCTVEVFANSTLHRQAEIFVASGQADAGGSWTVTVSHLPWPYLTASATHVLSGTSEINGPWDSGIRIVFLPFGARTP